MEQSLSSIGRKGVNMARLRISQEAEQRGIKLNQLYQMINTARAQRGEKFVAMGTMRRYWHSTENGTLNGPELDQISWAFLQEVAGILGVDPRALLPEDDTSGNSRPMLLVA
jgi:hypothetical protein